MSQRTKRPAHQNVEDAETSGEDRLVSPGSERWRILVVTIVVAVMATVTVESFVIWELYQVEHQRQREKLTLLANAWAALIESVARFDAAHSQADHPEGSRAATLLQIADAHEIFEGIGETGEFTLAERRGEDIVFLLSHHHYGSMDRGEVAFDSGLAQPMRLALLGEKGLIEGVDYRGKRVLAAYRPLPELGLGLVAKIDMEEVRTPFIHAGLRAVIVGVLVIALGALLVMLTINPIVRRMEARSLALAAEAKQRAQGEREIARQARVLSAVNEVFQKALICETEEELGVTCLAVAEKLTRSKFGFFGELNAKGTFDVIAISNPGWDACEMSVAEARKKTVDMPITGLDRLTMKEGTSRIVNDPSSHPDSVGTPPSHPPITAFLGVPLRRAGEVIGMIGLGNKESGYTIEDRDAVENLGVAMVEALRSKRAEDARDLSIADLEVKNAEMERFTYAVSHDLKSPLVTIKGFAGKLAKDVASGRPERVERDIGWINTAADKMQRLLDELLELSRVGRLDNPREDVDLATLAREIVELLEGPISASGAVVIVSTDLPTVHGDRRRLSEVLQNLIDNAVKHMGARPDPQVTVGSEERDGEQVIFVRDNGPGIDPRYHEKVFGLFDKLESDGKGTGIGLALVKRIIDVHGGKIWVESEGRDHGSSFCFTLPARKGGPSDADPN